MVLTLLSARVFICNVTKPRSGLSLKGQEMNTFVIIRELEAEDVQRIKTSAESFCKRHNIRFDSGCYGFHDAENAIVYYCYSNKQLWRLWLKCFCRAVKMPYDSRATTYGKYLAVRESK